MSKIALAPNAAGSATFTIEAPGTSTNRTLTLPDSTGTVVVTGGAQTIEFAAGTATAPSITTTGDTNTGIYFPAADNIGFATNGVIRGRWTTDGLCFGSDTAAANALDDYEEGTWTPALDSSGATFTYGANTGGTYVKIGRWLYLVGVLNMATKTGGTNANFLNIQLPFAAGAPDVSGSGVGYHISAATCSNLTVPAGYSGFPQGGVCTPGSASFVPYWTDGANNRIFQYGDVANGFTIQFSIAVYTNS